MRHPLWILNSALFFLFITIVCFVLLSRQPSPAWEDIEPTYYAAPITKKTSEVNISKIYEDDLFGTYQKEMFNPEESDYTFPVPTPPAPNKPVAPKEPVVQFLKPLNIVLKGIVAITNNETKNRTIIQDTITQKEAVYKVGDIIEDAQLIKISNKKIIFLRANGQQEVLYLRKKDAELDPIYASIDNWDTVAQKVVEFHYVVSPRALTHRVESLAHFIDLLNLTTAYQKGKSIGVHVGHLGQDSLGTVLGLKTGDIIISINDTQTIDTPARLKIYKEIIALKTKESIVVQLLRGNQKIALTFTLDELKEAKIKPEKNATPEYISASVRERASQQQLDMLHERHKFAPTLQEMREQERKSMLEKGKTTP